MLGSRGSKKHWWLCCKVLATVIPLVVLYSTALSNSNSENSMGKRREILASTEIPVEYIDPASIDLTPLVNALINSTQTGSKSLFSLLSVTSHSSLELHKLTVLVYNISNFKNIEPNMFPMKHCYCLTNKTNDLTDFTAVLLDVMGNSTSYLQELFKSSSILSVKQSNNSDCIYICVMAGKKDKDLSQLWEMDSIQPLFNQTITGNAHKGNTTVPQLPVQWYQLGTSSSSSVPFETSVVQAGPVHSAAPAPTTTIPTLSHSTSRVVTQALFTERPGCPWNQADTARVKADTVDPAVGNIAAVSVLKLQSCVLELCKFFSQCLCRAYDNMTGMKRYCVDHHPWYVRYTSEVCKRVKRISFSRKLKQKCLARMCTSP